MFTVERFVDGAWYYWGRYPSRERAEEVCNELWESYELVARVVEA